MCNNRPCISLIYAMSNHHALDGRLVSDDRHVVCHAMTSARDGRQPGFITIGLLDTATCRALLQPGPLIGCWQASQEAGGNADHQQMRCK